MTVVTAWARGAAPARTGAAIWGWLGALAAAPWFAYATLLLLQLKRIWGMWVYRDLVAGDTADYFAGAWLWFSRGKCEIPWSPLYAAFYGSLLHITRDACTVTLLHRVLIVLAATMMVLALARQMLPGALAWGVGAWWAMLPVNFDTQYEVHLFAVLPVLAAWLTLLKVKNPWGRGSAIGILLVAAVLVRNELVVSVALLTATFAVWEMRRRPRLRTRASWAATPGLPTLTFSPRACWPYSRLLIAYIVPILIAGAVVLFFFSRSNSRFPAVRRQMHDKHVVNMVQVFGYGYQQRHPEWTGDPWVSGGEDLCRKIFGVARPALGEMIRGNPRAIGEHFLWNFSLAPAGLQVMLFGCTSDERTPDYAPVDIDPPVAHMLSAAAAAIVLAGAILLIPRRLFWWRAWFGQRQLGWMAMLAVTSVALLIIPTQRPRPCYLFSLTVLLMLLVATSLWVIVGRWRRLRRLAPLAAVIMLAAPLVAHSAFGPETSSTPLKRTYERLRPFEGWIVDRKTVFLVGPYACEISYYFHAFGRAKVLFYDVFDDLKPDEPLAGWLARHQVNLLYLDRDRWMQLEAEHAGALRTLVDDRSTGWHLAAFEREASGDPWMLLRRDPPTTASAWFDPFHPLLEFSGWRAVSGFGRIEGPYPQLPVVRWGLGPASRLAFSAESGGNAMLELSGQSAVAGQTVDVLLDGRAISAWPVPMTFGDVSIPMNLTVGPHEIELHYKSWIDVAGSPLMAVLFRKVRIAPASK